MTPFPVSGTGKTSVITAFVALVQAAGERDLQCMAPTGRAASNIEDRCPDVKGKCSTIHSRFSDYQVEHTNQHTGFCLDEASMAGVNVMHTLLDKYQKIMGPLAVLGDDNQLPAIGGKGGCFLRDLLKSSHVPRVELTKIHRQGKGSHIAKAAECIIEGSKPIERSLADSELEEVIPDEWRMQLVASDEIMKAAVKRARDLWDKMGFAVQMLACRNASCDVGNVALQGMYNPASPERNEAERAIGKTPRVWRVGDRVVHLNNAYDNTTKERILSNGDMGKISDIRTGGSGAKVLVVTFPRGAGAAYNHTYTMVDAEINLLHAFCVTVHRSQGSEYKDVVAALENAGAFLSKELSYTSVTRGKRSVTMVTSGDRLERLLRRSERDDRVTRLSERLKEAITHKRGRA